MKRVQSLLFGGFIAFVALAAFNSCSEIPPYIDFSRPIIIYRADTTYVTTNLPTGVQRNILIEDISGVKCNNCPRAADIAHNIQADNDSGRVIVMTLHSWDFAELTAPYPESKDTLNTDEATRIVQNLHIGNVAGLPAGGIDRLVFEGETQSLIPYWKWEAKANERLAVPAVADLTLTMEVKEDRVMTGTMRTTFLQDIETPILMSLFILENDIKTKQKMPDNTYNKDYKHYSVLRKALTPITGVKLADNAEIGRVYERVFEFEVPEKYVFENCSVVALISTVTADDNEVLQSAEAHID